MASSEANEDNDSGHANGRGSRPFRFKQRDTSEGNDSGDGVRQNSRHNSHRRHHHRQKRQKRSHDGDFTDTFQSDAQLPPDVAFRESLFDAMGDDEGAAFWQGVYGQPIHTYPKSYIHPDTGKPEYLDDEQYARYVRQKMWEKSADGINSARESKRRKQGEERVRQERQKQRQPQDQSQGVKTGPHNNFEFDFEIEASLRRGQRRKDHKRWQEIWRVYQEKWQTLQKRSEAQKDLHANDNKQVFLHDYIAWPVETGKLEDVSSENIDRFVQHVSNLRLDQAIPTASGFLKSERIRWHPDKIQQKYGFMQVDEVTMAGVTAVFQILDNMWNTQRT